MKEKIVERIPQTVYWLDGLMHVPHLTRNDAYVRPGYGRHDVRFCSILTRLSLSLFLSVTH